MDVAERYRFFARYEAAGSSPCYARLSTAIADDPEVLAMLDTLPAPKQRPNLLFAAVRMLGGPTQDRESFRDFLVGNWSSVRSAMRERVTQTNEPARCATFLPLLAKLPPPLALIEVGASAGLCLYPDRYRYHYSGHDPIGPVSAVELDVQCVGEVPVPSGVPEVVWRAGVDLNPLDPRNDDDVAWLTACVWPEHETRRRRLLAAVEIATAEPAHLVAGDLVDSIEDVVAAAPAEATRVVFHSAVLYYVTDTRRARFAELMRSHSDVVWLSNEAPTIVPGLATASRPEPPTRSPAYFLLGVGGDHVAGLADPHGGWLQWLDQRDVQPREPSPTFPARRRSRLR